MLLYVEGESRYELYGREERGASWARMSSDPAKNNNNNNINESYPIMEHTVRERERDRTKPALRILPFGSVPKS